MKLKRNLTAAVLAGALMLPLAACASGGGSAATLAGREPVMPTADYWDVEQPDEASLDAVGNFAARSGELVLSGAENICYSPVSLYYALAMAGTGAAGRTQEEIYAALGTTDTDTLLHGLNLMFQRLYSDEKECRVYLANSIWMREGVAFYDTFTDAAAEQLYAACYTLDFDAPGAGKAITDWVSEQTKGLLKPEFELTPDSIAVLLNTVYFKANWSDEFRKENTREDTFTCADGSAVTCDFMHRGSDGYAVAVEGYTMASLPFRGAYRMFFLLPDEDCTIDGLLEERGLAALLDGSAAEYREIRWSVPKFTAKNEMGLVPVLEAMGVELAFSDKAADFSAMCDVSALPGQIAYISQVKQGVSFSIDEEGVEAAAYTEVAMNAGAAAPPEETVEMDLDRPFLYGVESGDGVILFIGRCDDPTKN